MGRGGEKERGSERETERERVRDKIIRVKSLQL